MTVPRLLRPVPSPRPPDRPSTGGTPLEGRHLGAPLRSVLPLLAFILSLAGILPAGSHPFLQNTCSVLVQSNRVMVRVTGTIREVAVTQRLDLRGANRSLGTVSEALPAHADYLLEHLDLGVDGSRLAGTWIDYQILAEAAPDPPGVPDPMDEFERTRVGIDLEYRLPMLTGDSTLTLSHRVLAEHPYAPGVPWDVTYALEVRDATRRVILRDLVSRGQTVVTPVGNRTSAAVAPPPDDPPTGPTQLPTPAGAMSYLRLGWHHVITGYDHLLFLGALTLATRRLRDLLRIILAFTAAHSLTVTLAALDWIRVPAAVVEPLIAASIVAVALLNLLTLPDSRAAAVRLTTAFAFGLVHGLGFAAGLREALTTSRGGLVAVAIGAFCIGVELGHVMLAGPFWALLGLARRRREGRCEAPLLRWGSLVVAGGGAYFLWATLRASP